MNGYRVTGVEMLVSYWLGLLAETYGTVGRAEEGLTVLGEALTVVHNTDERFYEAELYRLKGELLLQAGQRVEEAEECFQQALAVARHQQAKSWELRAAISLSHLWQQQGRRIEAHQILTEVYGWFTEGFDTADLQEARVVLEVLA